jgi:hypothetical protein
VFQMMQRILLAFTFMFLVVASANAATLTWDTTPGTVGPGNGTIETASGNWNTTNGNWTADGGSTNVAWNNGASDTAVIGGGSAATITLLQDINLGGLTFQNGNADQTISGAFNLNFAANSVIDSQNNTNNRNRTISTGITGSPDVRMASHGPSGGSENRLIFAPTGGMTQTLGVITNPYPDGSGDKHLLRLGGDTTGNTIESINYVTHHYGYMEKVGTGTWTVNGDVEQGRISVQQGTLIINGNVTSLYQGFTAIQNGGRLGGDIAYLKTDPRGPHFTVNSGGIVSPGNSIGTISVEYGTGRTDPAFVNFLDGSIYEWEVGSSSTDTFHIVRNQVTLRDRTLNLDNMVLKILDAGAGDIDATDQLPVFTYDPGVTIDMAGFGNTIANFDVSMLGATWSVTTLSLVDDQQGTIYLTGLANQVNVPEPASAILWSLIGLVSFGYFRIRRKN